MCVHVYSSSVLAERARPGGERSELTHCAFSHSIGLKFVLRVSCCDPKISRHSHTLQANGDYDKKAWLDTLKSVVKVTTTSEPQVTAI